MHFQCVGKLHLRAGRHQIGHLGADNLFLIGGIDGKQRAIADLPSPLFAHPFDEFVGDAFLLFGKHHPQIQADQVGNHAVSDRGQHLFIVLAVSGVRDISQLPVEGFEGGKPHPGSCSVMQGGGKAGSFLAEIAADRSPALARKRLPFIFLDVIVDQFIFYHILYLYI